MGTEKKHTLFEACGIAISGMVGGGIFAVLGEAVITAGNAAFLSLGVGGLLALITGLVYSRLTVAFDESGGEFIFIEHIAGIRFAGTVSWFLLLGYVLTIGLYSYAFGAYMGRLLGFGSGPNLFLGSGIVAVATFLILSGLRKSSISAHIWIYAKAVILTGLIALGYVNISPDKIFPVFNMGIGGTLEGAALVFVAYEGFQLLTYDYNTIEDHKKNLPKAVVISITTVLVIYMLIAFVLTGSLSAEVIARHKETVLAMLAEPVMGRLGVIIVLAAAVFSTASAILATIFATSRLAKRISRDGQLPHQLTDRVSTRVPVYFTLLIAALAIAVQIFGNLEQITTLASLTFLSVFSTVNFMGFKHKLFKGWKKSLPIIGSAGCVSAMVILLLRTYHSDPATIFTIIGMSAGLLLFREIYIWLHPKYKGQQKDKGKI